MFRPRWSRSHIGQHDYLRLSMDLLTNLNFMVEHLTCQESMRNEASNSRAVTVWGSRVYMTYKMGKVLYELEGGHSLEYSYCWSSGEVISAGVSIHTHTQGNSPKNCEGQINTSSLLKSPLWRCQWHQPTLKTQQERKQMVWLCSLCINRQRTSSTLEGLWSNFTVWDAHWKSKGCENK